MVAKLIMYRDELVNKKAMLENTIIDVEAKVQAYREQCVAEAEAKRTADVQKCASDIDCINVLIAREEAENANTEDTENNITE